MKQCEYNPLTDNAEEMIADWIEPPTESAPDVSGLPWCEIKGRESISPGMSRLYEAVFPGDAQPIWTVSAEEHLVDVVTSGQTLKLTVPATESAGWTISLQLQDAEDAYAPDAMEIKVVSLL
jgi:hypothetical protein